MQKITVFTLIGAFLGLQACNNAGSGNDHSFGAAIDTSAAVPVTELVAAMGTETSKDMKVSGQIKQVCQAEGCWFKYDQGNGQELLVRMKDHSFKIPKDLAGKTALVEGLAHYDTTSVEKLRDYAKDEGQSDEEVAAIVNPEVKLIIEAKGVVIR